MKKSFFISFMLMVFVALGASAHETEMVDQAEKISTELFMLETIKGQMEQINTLVITEEIMLNQLTQGRLESMDKDLKIAKMLFGLVACLAYFSLSILSGRFMKILAKVTLVSVVCAFFYTWYGSHEIEKKIAEIQETTLSNGCRMDRLSVDLDKAIKANLQKDSTYVNLVQNIQKKQQQLEKISSKLVAK